MEERFPLVDEEGTVVGVATRGACHDGSRLLHPVVHLHVFNAEQPHGLPLLLGLRRLLLRWWT